MARKGRNKVNYICAKCGKEKWTLEMNYTGEGHTCPSCKRGSPIWLNSQESIAKRDYSAISKKSVATKIAKYGSAVPQETKDKISNSLKTRDGKEESYKAKVENQRAKNNGEYFSSESKSRIGSWTKTDEGKSRISEIKKVESFKRRNSEEHRLYERNIISQRGYSVVEELQDDDGEFYFVIKCNECGEQFEWHMIGDVCRPYCKKCFKAPYSKLEKEVVDFLRVYGVELEENNRTILDGKELDIFISSKNLAIEFDGLYWHNNVDNSWKFEKCREKGIRLIRISEPEWVTSKDRIKDYLLHQVGKYNCVTVFGRHCEVKEISNEEYRAFVDSNHLQGYAPASIKLGLIYDGKTIQVMSFSKARFSKEFEYEMVRECSLSGWRTVGGKSKLLKYFIRKWKPKNIVSYCEKDKFSGKSYLTCGFTLHHESPPGYTYFKNSFEPLSRINFQKRKLKKLFPDRTGTEWEIMESEGYQRLFDYGQYVFAINIL